MRGSKRANSTGLTLFELTIVVAICAILGTLAVPSFRNFFHDAGRVSAVNEFIHTLMLARSESILRNRVVTLCKSRDGRQCSTEAPDWNGGWIVFVNLSRDDPPVRSANEPVLHVYAGWPGGRIISNRQSYSFHPTVQNVINGTVVFCDPRGSATARAVIVNNFGRPRLSQRDSSNKPLRCSAG